MTRIDSFCLDVSSIFFQLALTGLDTRERETHVLQAVMGLKRQT